MSEIKTVGLGEWHNSNEASLVIAALGLGSCVGVAAYDPKVKIGGMIHIVLPDSGGGADKDGEAKFADRGIPIFLNDLYKRGANKENLIVKICGGAQMLAHAGLGMNFNIGERNAEAVKKILKEMAIPLRGEDVGGTSGRTMRLYIDTGRLTVKTIGKEERDL